jgi:hypothetical protein
MVVIAFMIIRLGATAILHGDEKPPETYNVFAEIIKITLASLFLKWVGFF